MNAKSTQKLHIDLYRGMAKATLDAAYNNRAAVSDSARITADWEERSKRLRSSQSALFDLRYGAAERNRIDCFDAGQKTPWLAFIHGGYWQMRAKETFSFLAAGLLARGVSVAFIGYTLAPEKKTGRHRCGDVCGTRCVGTTGRHYPSCWLVCRRSPHGHVHGPPSREEWVGY